MPDICRYTDYRKFLQDYYEEARRKNPGFSYRVFSERAGIKSRGFLCNVLQGRRSLLKSNIFALAQMMRLNKVESDYFENLVAFNDAVTLWTAIPSLLLVPPATPVPKSAIPLIPIPFEPL